MTTPVRRAELKARDKFNYWRGRNEAAADDLDAALDRIAINIALVARELEAIANLVERAHSFTPKGVSELAGLVRREARALMTID